jgi:hypothetical protein
MTIKTLWSSYKASERERPRATAFLYLGAARNPQMRLRETKGGRGQQPKFFIKIIVVTSFGANYTPLT